MKKLSMFLMVGLLLVAVTAPALAWEFSMKGEFEQRYRYISRMGAGDISGNVDAAQATVGGGTFGAQTAPITTIGLSGPINNTVTPEGFSAKGSDAGYSELRADFYPEIRINPAIRFRAMYSLYQFNLNLLGRDSALPAANYSGYTGASASGLAPAPPHYAGWFFTGSRGAANDDYQGVSTGLWRQAYVTAQTPWGIIAAGKRPGAFGLGWSTLHEKETSADALALIVPYGPLTYIMSWYLHDSGESQKGGYVPGYPYQGTANPGTTALSPDAAGDPATSMSPSPTDRNEVRQWNFAHALTYRAGNVDMGTLSRFVRYNNIHGALTGTNGRGVYDDATSSFAANIGLGPTSWAYLNSALQNGATTAIPCYGDVDFLMQVNYFKYNNGRFFFNAEYNFQWAQLQRKGGRPISGFPTRWMVETGTVAGPAKATLAAFYSSGHDRRGGALSFDSPVGILPAAYGTGMVNDKFDSFLIFGGGEEAIKPYELLMGIYGGGNNSYSPSGYWRATDLLAYAARMDYAVAANLNLWGSFIYAERASNTGTSIGQYGLSGRTSAASSYGSIAPRANVPDNGLGWEANVGVNWKLLEGLTFNSQVAYWQPGDWFKWAYVDHALPAGSGVQISHTGGPAHNVYFVNPNRGIDPLIGFQGSMLVEF